MFVSSFEKIRKTSKQTKKKVTALIASRINKEIKHFHSIFQLDISVADPTGVTPAARPPPSSSSSSSLILFLYREAARRDGSWVEDTESEAERVDGWTAVISTRLPYQKKQQG